MARTRFALILYFRMVAYKAPCHTLSNVFFKQSYEDMVQILLGGRFFSHMILRLKICSMVLLTALNPVCFSAIISLAWGLNLFKMTLSMTLLG